MLKDVLKESGEREEDFKFEGERLKAILRRWRA